MIGFQLDLPLAIPGEPVTVAVVVDNDGNEVDRCWTWETGQTFALSEGRRVIAVADDGYMTIADAQALYDAERERYLDCFSGWGME